MSNVKLPAVVDMGTIQSLCEATSSTATQDGTRAVWNRLMAGHEVSSEFLRGQLYITLRQAVEVAKKIDLLKKAIFYGKQVDVGSQHVNIAPLTLDYQEARKLIKLIHGAMGVFGEGGELIEPLLPVLEGSQTVDEIDGVNIREECGDTVWYICECLNALGNSQKVDVVRADFQHMVDALIRKLHKGRYSEGYSDEAALNRDLDRERAALEGE